MPSEVIEPEGTLASLELRLPLPLVGCLLAVLPPAAALAEEKRPNFVVIMADERWLLDGAGRLFNPWHPEAKGCREGGKKEEPEAVAARRHLRLLLDRVLGPEAVEAHLIPPKGR